MYHPRNLILFTVLSLNYTIDVSFVQFLYVCSIRKFPYLSANMFMKGWCSMKKYNLIVVGGGLSGVAAAISAAREGLSVLLIESANCLGGAAVNCLVNPFMPYWTNVKNENGKSERYCLSRGIFNEILQELSSVNALDDNQMTFHEEYLKIVLNRKVQKEGIDLLFHSYLVNVTKNNGNIKSVVVANKSGNQEYFSDYFIDATGDADLAALSGSPYHLGRNQDNLCQPMTLCFRVGNVDLEKYKKSQPMINDLYQSMQRQGKIKNIREDVLIFSTLVNGVLHFNSTRIVKKNPINAFDITIAEIEAREQVFELFEFLKVNVDGFQNSQLLMTAAQIGVRESRMIDGVYVLTGGDLVACTKFEDSIAIGNYDIDIHNPEGSGTSHYYFPEGQYYTIPYRSLQPIGTNNLLVAGRCISTTHEAQASIRIMPICCCLGEAAGIAISVAAKDEVSTNNVNVNRVQAILKQNGALF